MYGVLSVCKLDGRGGFWSMEVYKFISKYKKFNIIVWLK